MIPYKLQTFGQNVNFTQQQRQALRIRRSKCQNQHVAVQRWDRSLILSAFRAVYFEFSACARGVIKTSARRTCDWFQLVVQWSRTRSSVVYVTPGRMPGLHQAVASHAFQASDKDVRPSAARWDVLCVSVRRLTQFCAVINSLIIIIIIHGSALRTFIFVSFAVPVAVIDVCVRF